MSNPHSNFWEIFCLKPCTVQNTFTTTNQALTFTRATKDYCVQGFKILIDIVKTFNKNFVKESTSEKRQKEIYGKNN